MVHRDLTAIASFLTIGFYESRRLQDQLDIQFNNKIKALNSSFASVTDLMDSTRAFLLHANHPTQSQFQDFLNQKTGIDSGIQSLLWAPKTSPSDITKLELKATKQGQLGYKVQPTHTLLCDTKVANDLFPIFYVSPQFEGSDYLGHQLGSSCNETLAMHRAMTNNSPVATNLIQEGNEGSKLFLPVIDEHNDLNGFIVANILFYEFLGITWQDEVNAQSLNIKVYPSLSDNVAPIFQSHLNSDLVKRTGLERKIIRSKHLYIPLLDRTWRIEVSTLDNSHSTLIYGGFCVLLILMLTCTVAWGARFYTHRLEISNKLVEEKTHSIEQQAVRDELTGLYNRQALNQHLSERVKQITTSQPDGFAVLFIDLDRFKMVNDSMGHLIGDLVLQQVANRLETSSRQGDICYRFGGDEFVICLANHVSESTLHDIAKRYNQLLSNPYTINGRTCHLGASIGVSLVDNSQYTLAQILREADTAMYTAKRSTSEGVVFFNDAMFVQAKQRFTLEQNLTQATEQQLLSLVYQPIYCQHSQTYSGVEALLRWHHPEFGYVSPTDFIPIAEETGLIVRIGDWVVKEACRTLESLWLDPDISNVPRVNINVSAKQFESNHILHTLIDSLNNAQFPPHLIGVEITESLLLSNTECTVNILKEMKALGVVIYLDDFGSGYSSLSVLSEYPIDILKMDKSFIDHVDDQHHKAGKLCKSIIDMAHAIALPVVAEGVETESQLSTLSAYKCDYIQGYLKSKPISKDELVKLLSNRSSNSEYPCKIA
ncbi:EAL domain-containing protein [Vibrio makurazakiensis]|uniref:bifunctional diguanylate cyclase/phosphodiesterase n=1 Tax=Vibrio makurazakiensis TaxID=2910250 RepID=UPI003D12910F